MRVIADGQTDRQTHTLTDANRICNLSHAICYSYGTDKNRMTPSVAASGDTSCSDATELSTEFCHVTPYLLQKFKINGSRVEVTARRNDGENVLIAECSITQPPLE